MDKALQFKKKSGKLTVDKCGWLICPICRRKKLMQIRPETQAVNLQVYCRGCHSELLVNINQGECFESHGHQ